MPAPPPWPLRRPGDRRHRPRRGRHDLHPVRERRLARGRRSGSVSAQVALTHPGTAGTDRADRPCGDIGGADVPRGTVRPEPAHSAARRSQRSACRARCPANDPPSHAPAQGASEAAAQKAYSAQKQFLTDRRPRLLSNLRAGLQGAASINRKDWDPSHKSRLGHWRGAHQGQDQPRVRRLGDSRPPGARTLTPSGEPAVPAAPQAHLQGSTTHPRGDGRT
jgi:hypothetical protein